jgi:hypothetical protein
MHVRRRQGLVVGEIEGRLAAHSEGSPTATLLGKPFSDAFHPLGARKTMKAPAAINRPESTSIVSDESL